MTIDIFLALLPWLAVLACPVMMLWMMRGMSGGRCHSQQPAGAARPDAVKPGAGGSADDEIRELRTRLARLEAGRHERTPETEVIR